MSILGHKKHIKAEKIKFFYLFLNTAMNVSMWCYYDVTWVLSENKLLRYILYQKTIKNFEFKKSRFWINRFLLKTKSPNKKRSADLKSALNFEFNYVHHYIWVWVRHRVRSILKKKCQYLFFLEEKKLVYIKCNM